MKLSQYAAGIASASLLRYALATPVPQEDGALVENPVVKRGEDKTKNKYFHEPGYVI